MSILRVHSGINKIMKYILTPNLKDPFNLIRIFPAYTDRDHGFPGPSWDTEDEFLAWVVQRNKEIGLIPCESEVERQAVIDDYAARHPDAPLIRGIGMAPKGNTEAILPAVGPHYIVDEADLPGGAVTVDNDYFFEAWEWNGSAVVVNMAKARTIHMAKIRRARNKDLAALDVPFMRAVETSSSSDQASIATDKQALRDIPATFDLTSAGTPDELKALWPSGLSR